MVSSVFWWACDSPAMYSGSTRIASRLTLTLASISPATTAAGSFLGWKLGVAGTILFADHPSGWWPVLSQRILSHWIGGHRFQESSDLQPDLDRDVALVRISPDGRYLAY